MSTWRVCYGVPSPANSLTSLTILTSRRRLRVHDRARARVGPARLRELTVYGLPKP